MNSNLYFFTGSNATEMVEEKYEKESYLQQIIADNPHLILRNEDRDGGRIALVAKEFSINEGDEFGSSFSLDHLFVDQDGTPILVEVKRSSDHRIRREVVGQIMDYASRASSWDVASLRRLFEANNPNEDESSQLMTDEFWEKVSICLKAERIKLVFAADEIPYSLKQLIEFLDRNMTNIEIYGVEIRQYATGGATLLSTNIVGNSKQKVRTSISQHSEKWSLDTFVTWLCEKGIGDASAILEQLLSMAKELRLDCVFGRGSIYPSVAFYVGSCRIVNITGASNRNSGNICVAETKTTKVATYSQNESWSPEYIKKIFYLDLPEREQYEKANLLWATPEYVHTDIRVLQNSSNFEQFKSAVAETCEAIGGKQF